MKATRVFETVLYADDLHAAERFYREVLGLDVIESWDIAVALRCGDSVILIFDPETAAAPGRAVPSHGARGPGHVAFAMSDHELDSWRDHLRRCGVEIEQEVEWKEGGRSLYFRDPAGNSIELAPPTLWRGGRPF